MGRPRLPRPVPALLGAAALVLTAACGGDPPAADASGGGGATPFEEHGRLRVCGTALCDEHGDTVQLRGMSTHGTQWYAQCVTDASLDVLAYDWGADVLRVSTYVHEDGWATNPDHLTDVAVRAVEAATERGLYAIVDWHMLDPGDPNADTALAEEFFRTVTARLGDRGNVLYEIANEPNGVDWRAIRSYAEEVVPVVREGAPDAVVLVGTRGWSSLGVSDGADESEILADPVGADNIMYTFHFYAASHDDPVYRDTLARAARELPLFVTEFGTQEATGDGPDDFDSAGRYLDLLDRLGVSWVNWNWSDDPRSGAVFEPGTCAAGAFDDPEALKPAGRWVRDRVG
ncbi:glycoside hydrolase family 5 protein [Streptomyces sp. RFCAC02]|uniref:glycoside hydrolase family 5 protein n=1 Tax=Streptomyces sp. RFCAC02 TaxID=2499143 RepID=UPI00101F69CE|nr:glycoside hydrolase family 5 protein [Streptomyces sp. RFCAC02]